MKNSEQSDVIAVSTLAAYGSLAFPLAAAFIALQIIIPTFYAESSALSLTAIGALIFVARVCDIVSDPIVGYWSDRSQHAFGRRKIFVISSAPFIALSVWFLFNPGSEVGWAYLLFWTIGIYVAGTFAVVPGSAWAAELSEDYHQRSKVTGVRVAFGLAGTLAALLVPALLNSENNLSATLFTITILVLVSLTISTLWAAKSVPDKAKTVLPPNSIASAWSLMKTENPFRQLLVSFLLNAVGNAIPATLFLLFVTHVLEVPELAGAFLLVYFVSAAVGVPVWVAISKRLGKHKTWSAAMLLACLFFVWAPLLDSASAFYFFIIVAVTGFAAGADFSLPSRRPGLFFALWGTATKLSYGLAIGIAFPLLELGDFSAVDSNSEQSLLWLAVLYGVPGILFKLAAVWTMRGYSITEDVHRDIRDRLASRS